MAQIYYLDVRVYQVCAMHVIRRDDAHVETGLESCRCWMHPHCAWNNHPLYWFVNLSLLSYEIHQLPTCWCFKDKANNANQNQEFKDLKIICGFIDRLCLAYAKGGGWRWKGKGRKAREQSLLDQMKEHWGRVGKHSGIYH